MSEHLVRIINPTEDKKIDFEGKDDYDYVNPQHYQLWDGMKAFELHKNLLSKDEYIGYLKGNILKYKLRAGMKPNEPLERDIAKMKEYQEELKNFIKE
jgi:hypothetical protein